MTVMQGFLQPSYLFGGAHFLRYKQICAMQTYLENRGAECA